MDLHENEEGHPHYMSVADLWELILSASTEENLVKAFRNEDLFEIGRSMALRKIRIVGLSAEANTPSVYAFCAAKKSGPFALSRGAVHSDLKKAEAILLATDPQFADTVTGFLKNEGYARGLGIPGETGVCRGFKPQDFAGHMEKLPWLQKVLKKVPLKVDWGFFFEASFLDYKNHVLELLKPQYEEPPLLGSFSEAVSGIIGKLGSIPGGSDEEESEEPSVLDPFRGGSGMGEPSMGPEELEMLRRVRPESLPPWNLHRVPSGILDAAVLP